MAKTADIRFFSQAVTQMQRAAVSHLDAREGHPAALSPFFRAPRLQSHGKALARGPGAKATHYRARFGLAVSGS
jgi:hypothetical protein